MKWETYKLMSSSQRMYWHYFFEKKLDIVRPNVMIYMILLYLSLSVLLFSSYFYFLASNYNYVWLLLGTAGKISLFMLMVWVSDYIASWIVYFIYLYKEYKWLRSEGLK
jgi:hypothetical protein